VGKRGEEDKEREERKEKKLVKRKESGSRKG
jgi:hypothetical protein